MTRDKEFNKDHTLPNPQVSVVIVSYNVCRLLRICLDMLYRNHSNETIEIIVVDNASIDESVSMVKDEFPGVRMLENKDNLGFPKANNQGFNIASGDFIFMLNPDTECTNAVAFELAKVLGNRPELSLIAPKLLNSDGTHQVSTWRFPTLYAVACDLLFLKFLNDRHFYTDRDLNSPFDPDSLSGAALFFRKSCLQETSGLDETMFWIEDIDFCFRLKKNKHRFEYQPKLTLIHHSGESAKKNYKISISNQVVNKIKYFRKHKPYWQSIVIQILSILHVTIKIAVLFILTPFNAIYYRKMKAYIYTYAKILNPPIGIK